MPGSRDLACLSCHLPLTDSSSCQQFLTAVHKVSSVAILILKGQHGHARLIFTTGRVDFFWFHHDPVAVSLFTSSLACALPSISTKRDFLKGSLQAGRLSFTRLYHIAASMCVEHISTALCAPTKTPSLSFTCGRLHLIAGKRDICDNAKGTCACFFGTCGQISRVAISSAVDWADVPKVRCVACTEREDHVGEGRAGRDLLESPLLTRHAINDAEQAAYMTRLRDLWQGSDSCPFHKDGQITVAQGELNEQIQSCFSLLTFFQILQTLSKTPRSSSPAIPQSPRTLPWLPLRVCA